MPNPSLTLPIIKIHRCWYFLLRCPHYLLTGAFNICSGWRLGGRHRKRSAVHIVFVERIERGSVHIVFVERALPTAPPLSLTGASRLLTLVETSVGAATPRRLELGMWSALLGAIAILWNIVHLRRATCESVVTLWMTQCDNPIYWLCKNNLQLELLWGLSDFIDKQGGQRRGLVEKAA